ncbi:protein ABIL2-like [Bidens hawaiensis]|uniref:protein ABIL2-like n=1 Tax=Bidens hawaiensis TaxID=980011 RepID=UPI00404B220C
MEEDSHSSQNYKQEQETEPQNHSKFSKSLQELKDLCSQLHAAAGYCESSFLNSSNKHLVVESTKEYVCRAVVAVVDHLGSVSANLDHHISEAELDTISQYEVRINLLKQKLSLSQEYIDKLALAKLTWRPDIPRYNSRYLKPPVSDVLIQNSSGEIVANTENNKHEFKIDEEVPLFFYTCIYKSSPQYGEYDNDDKATVSLSLSALPVRDNLSNQPKPPVPSFQLQEKRTNRRGAFSRKSMTSSEILSIIRRRK